MTNRELAMKMIPVLIYWAQNSWETPHYYSDLSKIVGHKSNQIGRVLEQIHEIIDKLGKENNCLIPTLNCIIVNKASKLPSPGFSLVLKEYESFPDSEKMILASDYRLRAHKYDWDWVLQALNIKPYHPSVSYWILPSNNDRFHLHEYLENHNIVDWIQKRNYEEGDILFLYSSVPDSKLCYMFRVVKTEITKSEFINNKDFWGDEKDYISGQKHNRFVRLKLVARLQADDNRLSRNILINLGIKQFFSPIHIVNPESINYILKIFQETDDYDPDIIKTDGETYFEGVKRQVTVNSYERDHKARLQCIKIHGTACSVCGIDFEKMYGELGKGFIHVHHIVPIHSIGKEYLIDPVKDLVPVCPNCHAMLHRGRNADARTIEELKELLTK